MEVKTSIDVVSQADDQIIDIYIRPHQPTTGKSKSSKKEETSKSAANVNHRRTKMMLKQKLANNFGLGDLFITVTYI